MKSIITVVGNRPQFIKMASVSHEIQKRRYSEIIVHTGQHYDKNMKDIFFEEMNIPKPNYQLSINSRKHGGMTAEMLVKLESLFEDLKPRGVFIYGDTNSTLAASLAAIKLKIPLSHVESGPRIYDIDTPEEINRLVADHGSCIKFCSDLTSVQNLAKENITKNVYLTGDVMYDSYLKFSQNESDILERLCIDNKFALFTVHRPNNSCSKEALVNLLKLIDSLELDVVFPVHPRKAR
jgi:UDP-GlcNAc3NAcA epimerase